MQVKVHDGFGAINGTHLQGYVETTFEHLVELFGDSLGGGDKTTQEWVVEFSDGTIATVYDWKEYETPMGMYHWHVGGTSKQALWNMEKAVKGNIPVVANFSKETA